MAKPIRENLNLYDEDDWKFEERMKVKRSKHLKCK